MSKVKHDHMDLTTLYPSGLGADTRRLSYNKPDVTSEELR